MTDLNIIDLISEKHARLRKQVITAWAKTGEAPVSDTESYFLAIVEREQLPIAQIARVIGISRQGAHKCAQSLITQGYLEVITDGTSQRDKFVRLTDKGHAFCNETLKIKLAMQAEIEQTLGSETYALLYQSLKQDW
ncbi:MAG: MarR family transcriptional regulator [Culicoidibacterales bacterium]